MSAEDKDKIQMKLTKTYELIAEACRRRQSKATLENFQTFDLRTCTFNETCMNVKLKDIEKNIGGELEELEYREQSIFDGFED